MKKFKDTSTRRTVRMAFRLTAEIGAGLIISAALKPYVAGQTNLLKMGAASVGAFSLGLAGSRVASTAIDAFVKETFSAFDQFNEAFKGEGRK